MTLWEQEDAGSWKRTTGSYPQENSIWKRLWTCLKADYVIDQLIDSFIFCVARILSDICRLPHLICSLIIQM